MSNAGLFRRYEKAQHQLLLSTMPKSGVIEYDDLLSKVKLTGRRWVNGSLIIRSRTEFSLAARREA